MEMFAINAFFRDEALHELTELFKTTDDLLEVIKLNEVQHSDTLAWCMNPNEGHGQGDAVIKDFLLAAYSAFEQSSDSDGMNRHFFGQWTPGRISTASFGGAFITRELSVNIDVAGKSKGRLDLFLLDPHNRILVAIENKVDATLTAQQLDKYVAAVEARFGKHELFKTYGFAYIVLDRELAGYSNEHLAEHGKGWTLLNYNWLEASARRARLQLERGNSAAQLLIAYCEKQTNWKSPAHRRISTLVSTLVLAHPKVLQALQIVANCPFHQWTAETLAGHTGELTLFYVQQRPLCDLLLGRRASATLAQMVREQIPRMLDKQIEVGRTWINAAPIEAVEMMNQSNEAFWPIYLNVFRNAKATRDADEQRFTVRLGWHHSQFDHARYDQQALRELLLKRFPVLSRGSSEDHRSVVVDTNLTALEAITKFKALFDEVAGVLASVPRV